MEIKNISDFSGVFGYLLLNFFFDPLGVGHISCTSKSYANRVREILREWLQRNENVVFHDPGRASSKCYFAAQLFRSFLRKVLLYYFSFSKIYSCLLDHISCAYAFFQFPPHTNCIHMHSKCAHTCCGVIPQMQMLFAPWQSDTL